jgi:hypothetical protein
MAIEKAHIYNNEKILSIAMNGLLLLLETNFCDTYLGIDYIDKELVLTKLTVW